MTTLNGAKRPVSHLFAQRLPKTVTNVFCLCTVLAKKNCGYILCSNLIEHPCTLVVCGCLLLLQWLYEALKLLCLQSSGQLMRYLQMHLSKALVLCEMALPGM